ncbi:hypothetical protein ACFL2K_04670 [Candidatus Margulisiibacteriota bacterium]
MAIPIQATPNIKEKDAEKFYRSIEKNENITASDSTISDALDSYNAILKKNPNIKQIFSE